MNKPAFAFVFLLITFSSLITLGLISLNVIEKFKESYAHSLKETCAIFACNQAVQSAIKNINLQDERESRSFQIKEIKKYRVIATITKSLIKIEIYFNNNSLLKQFVVNYEILPNNKIKVYNGKFI